jgi:hypothetical protein
VVHPVPDPFDLDASRAEFMPRWPALLVCVAMYQEPKVELADRLGVSRQTIHAIESGRRHRIRNCEGGHSSSLRGGTLVQQRNLHWAGMNVRARSY